MSDNEIDENNSACKKVVSWTRIIKAAKYVKTANRLTVTTENEVNQLYQM